MSLEQSIDNLAAAILALAHAAGNAKVAPPSVQGVEAPAGKPPAATRPAATKAVKVEPASGSPSEGKPAKGADTPPTAQDDAAPSEKEIDYEADIKPLFLKLVQTMGRDEGRAFIDSYKAGAPKLADAIKPSQYAEVVAKLQGLPA